MFILSWLCPQKLSTVWGRLFHLTFLKNILERGNRKTAGPKEQRRHLSPAEQFNLCGNLSVKRSTSASDILFFETHNQQWSTITTKAFFLKTLLSLILDYCNRVCYVYVYMCCVCWPSTRVSRYLSNSSSFFTASSEILGAPGKHTSTTLMLSLLPCRNDDRQRRNKHREREIQSMQYTTSICSCDARNSLSHRRDTGEVLVKRTLPINADVIAKDISDVGS